MLKRVYFLLFVFFLSKSAFSQCSFSVTSTNGWVANVSYSVTSISITTNASNCATNNSYYQFAPVVTYSITFTGSTSNRSITLQNMCVDCINKNQVKSCTDCANSVGTFNSNASGSIVVNNNNCEYDAPYTGSSLNCTALNLTTAGCSAARVDVYGNGISYTSAVPCSGINPLPIELISFTGNITGYKANLKWSTATETNNKYFTVEKSKDGTTFEEFAQVNGANNSTETINYSLIDNSPYAGLSYYRLKQTDNNGAYKYMPIISVENKITQVAISNIHPNPTTTGNFNFDVYSPGKATLRIQLIDNMARNVFEDTQSISENQSKINVETTSIPAGVYILKTSVLETGVTLVNKIIKN